MSLRTLSPTLRGHRRAVSRKELIMNYETQLHDSQILCLSCGKFFEGKIANNFPCPHCYSEIDYEFYEEVFKYSYYFVRYGYQYLDVLCKENPESETKFCLGDLNEIYTFIAVAAASGVIGGLSTDLVKLAIKKIIKQVKPSRSGENVIVFSDDEIESYISKLISYRNGFSGLPSGVRNAIFEEIMGDAIGCNEALSNRIQTLLGKEKIKPKHKKQIADLYKQAILEHRMKIQKEPSKTKLATLWQRLSGD